MAVVVSLGALVPNVRLYRTAQSPGSVAAQLRFLRGELRAGAGEDMQRLFPEGYFFSHVLYGLTWVEVALEDPDRRGEALREARWALRRLDGPEGRAPFDGDLRPAHGVFYAGWSSWLRAKVVELAGPDAPEATRLAADGDDLAAAFADDGPFLEAYPGDAWPVDSVVAVAALRLHDRLLEPRYAEVVDRWVDEATRRLDPGTGLLPHRVEPAVEGTRGSSQSVIQRFLPEIDPEWADGQYRRFRRQFVVTRLGQPGVREYPPGRGGPGDVDSGPLVLGLSASASVVTIGAARAHGDQALAGPLTGLGEALGMPLPWGSTRRYALGQMPIGDAFLAWSAIASPPTSSPTPTPTPAPTPATAPAPAPGVTAAQPVTPPSDPFPAVVPWWWRLPWHTLTLLTLALVWLPAWRRARGRRASRGSPGPTALRRSGAQPVLGPISRLRVRVRERRGRHGEAEGPAEREPAVVREPLDELPGRDLGTHRGVVRLVGGHGAGRIVPVGREAELGHLDEQAHHRGRPRRHRPQTHPSSPRRAMTRPWPPARA